MRIDTARLWRGILRYRYVAAVFVVLAAIIVIFPAADTPGTRGVSGKDVSPRGGIAAPVATVVPNGAPGATGATDGRPLPEDCDPKTGRIRFPSVYAPPCVYPVDDNGGATSRGVTADSIKVVRYRAQANPSVQALLRSSGAADLAANVDEQYDAWFEMFQATYETYGRQVTVEVFDATAPPDDDAAARADAVTVATTLKPFIVVGGPEAFMDELARREIIVITQFQGPIDFFQDRAPYVYGTQMSSTQAFLHLAEYIGKRLKGNAVHAGDEALTSEPRKFGLIYAETPSGLYGPGIDSFEQELKRYGVTLTDKISYLQELATAQEQSRTIVSRLKDRGVTTVLFAGDPIAPVFFTQQATLQDFYPEWVIGGGNLVDTTFFGRRYEQTQWAHAFGVSQLWIRPPRDETEVYQQHVWFHGRPPFAGATFEILYQEPLLIFTAIHMAGADLNPTTFRDGLFSFPPSGGGLVTQLQRSWGEHGVYPFTDWTGFDTTTEIWWDADAVGDDEVGNSGYGQYRFIDGGKRYAPGERPSTAPRVFDAKDALTGYDALPDGDRYPEYPEPN
jgi:hypothetical protein